MVFYVCIFFCFIFEIDIFNYFYYFSSFSSLSYFYYMLVFLWGVTTRVRGGSIGTRIGVHNEKYSINKNVKKEKNYQEILVSSN